MKNGRGFGDGEKRDRRKGCKPAAAGTHSEAGRPPRDPDPQQGHHRSLEGVPHSCLPRAPAPRSVSPNPAGARPPRTCI